MTRTLIIFTAFFIAAGFIKISNGQSKPNQQILNIERQIDSVFRSAVKAAENLEFDKLSNGVDDTYKAGFISNGDYYTQYDSLINYVKTRSQGVAKQSITIQHEKITVLTDDIVLLTASGETKVDVNSGNQFTAKFFWSFVYKNINNNWKVIQSHQSNNR